MALCRWLVRWQLFFRTRRRTLRLLLLTGVAAFTLLMLALTDLPERRLTGGSGGDSSRQQAHTCPRVTGATADLDLTEVFPTLNFTVSFSWGCRPSGLRTGAVPGPDLTLLSGLTRPSLKNLLI